MSDKTGIQWTDATWNPVRGCTKVSAGCDNCYAMQAAGRMDWKRDGREGPYYGLTRKIGGRPQWNGNIRTVPHLLDQPVRWTKPRMIFVNSMSDLFHEGLSDAEIGDVFWTMERASQHFFQVLTKRPERMVKVVRELYPEVPPGNVWLGVSVEDQATANERIPLLLQTPAAVRWISAEPLLAPVNLHEVWARMPSGGRCLWDVLRLSERCFALDWVVVGGESGPRARPFEVEWARSLRDQCKAFGVPFFFKQYGSNPYLDSEHSIVPHLHDSHGGDWDEWPAQDRVREWPDVLREAA